MADVKIQDLPSLTPAQIAALDLFVGVDVSTLTAFKLTKDDLHQLVTASYIADQATAEAGADNAKLLSPLRGKQLMDANLPASVFRQQVTITAPTGAASADLTAFDATKFAGYRLLVQNFVPAAGTGPRLILRTSTDGGTTWDQGGADYDYVYSTKTLQNPVVATDKGKQGQSEIWLTDSDVSDTGVQAGLSLAIDIIGPHVTSGYTRIQWSGSYTSTAMMTPQVRVAGGGVRLAAADVDAVQVLFDSGNIDSGEATLIGIPNV